MSADLPFPARLDPGLGGPLGSLGGPPGDLGGLGAPEDTGGSGEPALRTVRLAWAADAPAVAAAQAADLRRVLAPRTGVEELPEPADLEPSWRQAITRPPTARHRVLVAVELGVVVGFAATAPADDPDSDLATDGELVAVHAAPRGGSPGDLPGGSAGGTGPVTGTGSAAARESAVAQLLAALTAGAADTMAADGFARAQVWVATTDDVLRVVLAEAGWEPDGATRSFAGDTVPGGQPLHQVRLHVGLGGS